MSAISNGTPVGNSLQALGTIRASVRKLIVDRMEDSVRKVWEKDNFFRQTFTEEDLNRYLDASAGENGVFTSALLREIFGIDKSMPDPKEFQRFCEKCHRKVGIAYKFRKIQEDGKPAQYWGGQFAIILNNVKSSRDPKYNTMFKVGCFCSDCQPSVKLNEKTFWQPYEYALRRLQNMTKRREEEKQKEAERTAAERRKNLERQKFEGELETAQELDALLDADREAIRALMPPNAAEEVEELTLADLVAEVSTPEPEEAKPEKTTRPRAQASKRTTSRKPRATATT